MLRIQSPAAVFVYSIHMTGETVAQPTLWSTQGTHSTEHIYTHSYRLIHMSGSSD